MIERFNAWCMRTAAKLRAHSDRIRSESEARQRAHEEIMARMLVPTLRWTEDKPTGPGQYWIDDGRGIGVVVVEIYRGELLGYSHGSEETFLVRDDVFIRRWAGPIPEPQS